MSVLTVKRWRAEVDTGHMPASPTQMGELRRLAGWALVGGLCLAAATAILALVSGSFDDTDVRVILTSLGFSLFSATAAAGSALRLVGRGLERDLGVATVAVSAVAYVLALGLIWIDPDGNGLWRVFGAAGVVALCGSHASLVLKGRRAADGPALTALVGVSLATSVIDTLLALVPIAGLYEDVSETHLRIVAVLVVVLLLTSVLPPIVRRLRGPAAPPAPADPFGRTFRRARTPVESIVAELHAAADRLEASTDVRALRRESERLRELARSFTT